MKAVLDHGGVRGRYKVKLLRSVGMHAESVSLKRTGKANTASGHAVWRFSTDSFIQLANTSVRASFDPTLNCHNLRLLHHMSQGPT
jgi:hypothetical protein